MQKSPKLMIKKIMLLLLFEVFVFNDVPDYYTILLHSTEVLSYITLLRMGYLATHLGNG
jgi:hypothetical protein